VPLHATRYDSKKLLALGRVAGKRGVRTRKRTFSGSNRAGRSQTAASSLYRLQAGTTPCEISVALDLVRQGRGA
jgi:hypothetical protein